MGADHEDVGGSKANDCVSTAEQFQASGAE